MLKNIQPKSIKALLVGATGVILIAAGIHYIQNQLKPSPKKKKNVQKQEGRKITLQLKQFEFLGDQLSISPFQTLKNGQINQYYNIVNPPISKSSFGCTKKGVHKISGKMFAINIINRSSLASDDQAIGINQVNILTKIDHPNIIKIFECYEDKDSIYIITELCTGGEMFDKIIEEKTFSEKQAAKVFKQLISAVQYCHQHNIIHRDLKPENILYETKDSNSAIKVIDFGASIVFDQSKKMNQKQGTPYYIAPEVLKQKYDEKCDIWSCGVILYIILAGYPPFNGPNDRAIMERVKSGVYSMDTPEFKSISQEAKNLIRNMLELDPIKRYSASDVMKSEWLAKFIEPETIDHQFMLDVLEKLRKFQIGDKKLQQTVFIQLLYFIITQQEKDELLKIFLALDTNGDGQLSREELINSYLSIAGLKNADNEVNLIMQAFDKNNSGQITFTEFLSATINRQKIIEGDSLEILFKLLNTDGSGAISRTEFQQHFEANKIIDNNIWEQVISEFDKDQDGKISYEEFKQMMQQLL